MTRQELQEKIIDLYAGSAPKRTLPGVFSDEILHLIDEYVAGGIPEKQDMRPEITEWLISEDYSKGYNQAIDDMRRRAGIGEDNA